MGLSPIQDTHLLPQPGGIAIRRVCLLVRVFVSSHLGTHFTRRPECSDGQRRRTPGGVCSIRALFLVLLVINDLLMSSCLLKLVCRVVKRFDIALRVHT